MGSEEESRPENQAEANEAHEQSDAAAFYEEQAEALQDTPEVQRLVQLRAAEMRGHQIGEAGSAPGQTKDLSVAEEEVVHTEIALTIIGLRDSVATPQSNEDMPTLAEVKPNDPVDATVADELLAILGTSHDQFDETDSAPTALRDMRIVRKQEIRPPGQTGKTAVREKYFLQHTPPEAQR